MSLRLPGCLASLFVAGLFCVVSATFLPRAAAQAGEVAGEVAQEYEAAVAAAMTAHRAGRWDEARALFTRAHALYPNARTLRGLGVSAFEAGRFSLAVRDLEGALVHEQRPLSPELRRAVEDLLVEARAQVGMYRLSVEPQESTLLVDGEPPVWAASGELLLDAGLRVLRLESAGHREELRELRVEGGEREALLITLPPLPVTPPAQAPAEPPAPRAVALEAEVRAQTLPLAIAPLTKRDALSTPERRLAPYAWAVSGGSVAAFASAAVLWSTVQGRVRDIADDCGALPMQECTTAQLEQHVARENIGALERGTTASVVVGAALAVTAGALWVLELRGRKKTRAQRAFRAIHTF